MKPMRGARKPFFYIFAAIAVIAVVAGGMLLLEIQNYQSAIENMTFSSIDITTVPDGTYVGDFDAGLVYAKVSVAVKDGTMKDLKLLEHRNGKGASAESIIDVIIEKQTTHVDSISGATSSSKVIRKAVENALLQE